MNGSRIKLQDQPFQILRLLLVRPGKIVTREEIQQKLWPDGTFVDSRVHETFQKLYDDLLLEKRHSLDELLAHFWALWEQHWTLEIKIVRKNMTSENYRDYGEGRPVEGEK